MKFLTLIAVVSLTSGHVLYFKPHDPDLGGVICPDGKSECPTGNTCCKTKSGDYGCCYLPNANCCGDGSHCCPANTRCDLVHKRCISSGVEVSMLENFPAKLKEKSMFNLKNSAVFESEVLDVPAADVEHITWRKVLDSWSKGHPGGVMCPDGISECKAGQTCCLNEHKRYGCCPMTDAVCCSDGVHCCPSGYECDVAHGQCDLISVSVNNDDMEKMVALEEGKVKTIPCPDGSSCKDGDTCCAVLADHYGCCPRRNAVCCEDKKHCCPHGYTCDSSSGKCEKGNSVIEWLTKVEALKTEVKEVKVKNVSCPDGSSCKDGSTCCKVSADHYGCCPRRNAVCCADMKHCCPHGYTCDSSSGKCEKGNNVIEWLTKVEALKTEVKEGKAKNIPCPGGSSCKDGSTCCKTLQGYGCCPTPNAECCKDEKHCCPHGYTCDSSGGRCTRGNSVIEWLTKIEALKTENKEERVKYVVCPDGSSCEDGNTCCRTSQGYGCCPKPNAVCCSDGVHCCPSGYECDVAHGQCHTTGQSFNVIEKLITIEEKMKNVPCPDHSSCKDGNTCCRTKSGYGCCPKPDAVCCSDMKHCCPHGYTCSSSSGTCTRGNNVIDWLTKVEALKTEIKEEYTLCAGGTAQCQSGYTCCKSSRSHTGYSCCPQPNAECCEDMEHCCPHGYKCESSGGRCIKGNSVIEWLTKVEALKTENKEGKVKNIPCPDGSSCVDGDTCCPISADHYGCCPTSDAVCCEDKKHCCPHGYTCDSSGGKCKKGNRVIEWLTKVEALKTEVKEVKVKKVQCPDGSSCKDGSTCCKISADHYGCCPRRNAVCCEDKKHCCPHGYTCDSSSGKCEKGNSVIEWLTKVEALKTEVKEVKVKKVQCPDGSSCKDGSTCCKISADHYGCCPRRNAVCCADMKHCCPHGYTCDSSGGKCEKGDSVIEWLTKVEALKTEIKEVKVKNVSCPDGSSCKDGSTCCKVSADHYGCCPRRNAVCCADMKHCCPHGYTCDSSGGKCEKGDSVIEWLTKVEALKTEIKEVKVKNVSCPDGSSCKDGSTCCKVSADHYGCCPRRNAVCCADMKHCCPHGYTCDSSGGKCEKGDSVIEWLTKVEALKTEIKEVKVKNVSCPDGSSCKDGSTCCKVSADHYGCCPRRNAVCCADMKHCCPHGYTCDSSGGKCEKGDSVIEWLTKVEALKTEIKEVKVKNVSCPDGSSCKDGSTCCKVSADHYGCCPRRNAVCCADMKHCCPHGYTCDSSGGKCEKGDSVIEWLTKVEALKTEIKEVKVKNVSCPDGSSCKDGSTCCKVSADHYGCCPRRNAVCCADMKHCCPHGYTCDSSSGKCEKGNSVIEWLTKVEALKTEVKELKVKNVSCPDGSSCKDGSTCCKISADRYGCCPTPNASCCKDHKHCCPHGYTCDTGKGTCSKGDTVIEWLSKVDSVKMEQNVTNTCCGNSTCCPYSKPICCTNADYCCPPDYICDEVPYCCRDPDGKSKSRGVYYNLMLKEMAKKMGVTLKDPE